MIWKAATALLVVAALGTAGDARADDRDTCLNGTGSKAFKACAAAAKANPKDVKVLTTLGRLHNGARNFKLAVKILKRAAALAPGNASIKALLARAQSNLDEQEWMAKRKSEKPNASASANRMDRIKCLRLTGKAAIKACRKVLKSTPNDTEIRTALKSHQGGSDTPVKTATAAPAPKKEKPKAAKAKKAEKPKKTQKVKVAETPKPKAEPAPVVAAAPKPEPEPMPNFLAKVKPAELGLTQVAEAPEPAETEPLKIAEVPKPEPVVPETVKIAEAPKPASKPEPVVPEPVMVAETPKPEPIAPAPVKVAEAPKPAPKPEPVVPEPVMAATPKPEPIAPAPVKVAEVPKPEPIVPAPVKVAETPKPTEMQVAAIAPPPDAPVIRSAEPAPAAPAKPALAAPAQPAHKPVSKPVVGIEAQLSLLKRLHEQGLVNDAEFERRKIALLDNVLGLGGPVAAPPKPKPADVVTVAPKLTDQFLNEFGGRRYHALIIGNNDYEYLPNLQTAVNDAFLLADVLENRYGFETTVLRNANRRDILKAMSDLRRSLTEDDSLLVYYAGHGILDEDAERGYWLPVDAEEDIKANWISTADITDVLKATDAWHAMVVADSCYSGTLVRAGLNPMRGAGDRYALIKRLAQKRSRTVFTSGGLEPVADGGGGGNHSVFARALIDTLRDNEDVIEAQNLFGKVRARVVLNADQTPEYSDVRKAGHDGGDFIFVPRNGE